MAIAQKKVQSQYMSQLVNLLEVSFLSVSYQYHYLVTKVDQEKERERERLDERRGRREVNIKKRLEECSGACSEASTILLI